MVKNVTPKCKSHAILSEKLRVLPKSVFGTQNILPDMSHDSSVAPETRRAGSYSEAKNGDKQMSEWGKEDSEKWRDNEKERKRDVKFVQTKIKSYWSDSNMRSRI